MPAIWIDLDNSPHVPLFAPIVRHYRDLGIDVILTSRDHSQTTELLDLQGFAGTYNVLGEHPGTGIFAKVFGTLGRARSLAAHVRSRRMDIAVAVSHGSRSMVLAARRLRIPVLTMFDYEYTETRIFNRFSDKVLVPDGIPDEVLDEIGLPTRKRVKYPGLKEELYVRSFAPTRDLRGELISQAVGDPAAVVLVVVRPPASTANYHSPKTDELFSALIRMLLNTDRVFTVIVPRTAQQSRSIGRLVSEVNPAANYVIQGAAVDGLELAAAADLVISGGGTMNREAALLGVPVYSIFAGRQGALDRQMEADGRIKFIRDVGDLAKIRLERRDARKPNTLTDRVERFVIGQIDEFLNAA